MLDELLHQRGVNLVQARCCEGNEAVEDLQVFFVKSVRTRCDTGLEVWQQSFLELVENGCPSCIQDTEFPSDQGGTEGRFEFDGLGLNACPQGLLVKSAIEHQAGVPHLATFYEHGWSICVGVCSGQGPILICVKTPMFMRVLA
jgi:hypothetical protein